MSTEKTPKIFSALKSAKFAVGFSWLTQVMLFQRTARRDCDPRSADSLVRAVVARRLELADKAVRAPLLPLRLCIFVSLRSSNFHRHARITQTCPRQAVECGNFFRHLVEQTFDARKTILAGD